MPTTYQGSSDRTATSPGVGGGSEDPLVAHIEFRSVSYVISMAVLDRSSQLLVDVEDSNTTDHWTGQYDAEYIEELTHKTANYKQFSVFVNMLKSSILKSSDSVGLDLLTFGDLQLLRKRKTTRDQNIQLDVGDGREAILAKRYLILTYNVEFDRIHYPLPLEYKGKPKPMELRQTIRDLNRKVLSMEKQATSEFKVDTRPDSHMKKELSDVITERNRLEREFSEYRHMHNAFVSTNNIKNNGSKNSEVRQLKGIIGRLEKELAISDNKQTKMGVKRADKYNRLADEVEELRISKRGCMNRIKNLTNEIEECKRSNNRKLNRNAQSSRPLRQRSSSRESYFDPHTSRDTGASCVRRTSHDLSDSSRRSARPPRRQTASRRDRSGSTNTARGASSTSRDRSARHSQRRRPSDHRNQRQRNSAEGRRRYSTGREESPSGSLPRFDPTAYIKEKKRQQNSKDNDRKTREKRTRNLGMSRNSARSSRTPSGGSMASSMCSLSEINSETDVASGVNNSRHSAQRSRPPVRNSGRKPRVTEYSSADSMDYAKLKSDRLSSTPDRSRKRQSRKHHSNNYDNNNLRDYRNQNIARDQTTRDKDSLNEFIDNSHEMEERLSRIQKFLDEAQS